MKNIIAGILLAVLLLGFGVSRAQADEGELEGGVDSKGAVEGTVDGKSTGGQGATSTYDSLNLNEKDWDPLGGGTTVESLLHRIVDYLTKIATPIAAAMVIYGAYQMLFAAGEPEKFKTGRNTILYTVIGYAIIVIGWGFTSIIEEFLK